MFSIGLVLQSLLLVYACLPHAAGDCYDEPPNNKSYENCAKCYQTFANALINTADNKYLISRTFFPINSAVPVQVEVTYQSNSGTTEPKTLFWVMGGFYVFRPLDVFLYRSLFFSPPIYRKESVIVTLPDECFGGGDLESYSNFNSTSTVPTFF